MATNSSTRETRAQALIDAGAVTLLVGTGSAQVRGSGQNVYRVTSAGCTCPDRTKRGEACKHEIAVKALCGQYRECQAAVQRGERVRPSSALLQAIRWPEKTKATGCQQCGAPTGFDVCSGCYFSGPALNLPGAA